MLKHCVSHFPLPFPCSTSLEALLPMPCPRVVEEWWGIGCCSWSMTVLLFVLTLFLCSIMGSSTGCSPVRKICSSRGSTQVVFPWDISICSGVFLSAGSRKYLLCHGEPPPFFSNVDVSLSLTLLVLSSSLPVAFSALFKKKVFKEVVGSAVFCYGSTVKLAGTGWNRLSVLYLLLVAATSTKTLHLPPVHLVLPKSSKFQDYFFFVLELFYSSARSDCSQCCPVEEQFEDSGSLLSACT